MKDLKKLHIKVIIFYLLIFILFIGCNKRNSNRTIYYNYYNINDSLTMYIIKNIDVKENLRKEIDSFISLKGKLENIRQNTFIIDKNGLKKVSRKTTRPYLTIKNKNCIDYKLDNEQAEFAKTKYCFIEKTDVKINNKKYSNVYKFIKTTGTLDGVQSVIYLDIDFILLKEEYLSGYGNKYIIERIDK